VNSWDDPWTPIYYEAFCRDHARYRLANEALIGHACLAPGMRVLDLAAGTGRTAEAAMQTMMSGEIVCVDPSAPMRTEGQRRLGALPIEWRSDLPVDTSFDRILCGAGFWQLDPEKEWSRLPGLLKPSGAICFNVPALYLLEPNGPDADSWPFDLVAHLIEGRGASPANESRTASAPLTAARIERWLANAALAVEAWEFFVPLTPRDYADWLKIPAVNRDMMPELTPPQRADRIETALATLTSGSPTLERWRGWTAWKT